MKNASLILMAKLVLTAFAMLAVSCQKQAFLDKKPSTNLLVPTTFSDFQELLDNTQVMGITPVLGEMSADNFYLTYLFWQSLDAKEYNAYIWAQDLYGGQGLVQDWDIPYSQVFYGNVVLEGLAKILPDTSEQAQWNMLEGEALFTRAYAYFNVAELFAPPYDSATANTDMGIPLRDTADINASSVRATVKQTYDQLLGDLRKAAGLLPAPIPVNNLNRPSRLAAQALLARIYLSVGDYTDAGHYADSVLRGYSVLVDYNGLDTNSIFPVLNNMPEILYQSNFLTTSLALEGLIYPNCLVDTALLASYAPDDLRRGLYYKHLSGTSYYLKGSYAGSIFPFSGLATDELFLIRAECSARAGLTGSALNDLDTLMIHRVLKGEFTGYAATNAADALDTILVERRKELAFRGIRWSDLRRLNKEESRSDTLKRSLNGVMYTLLPNSDLYTLPIPPDVLSFNPGMKQNPR